jgi:hypothetical protein
LTSCWPSCRPGITIVGIDELTALTLDFDAAACRVAGLGSVHILRNGQQQDFPAGSTLSYCAAGGLPAIIRRPKPACRPRYGGWHSRPPPTWRPRPFPSAPKEPGAELPLELQQLLSERESARQQRDWPRADQLRQQITELGWQVTDSPSGPKIKPV